MASGLLMPVVGIVAWACLMAGMALLLLSRRQCGSVALPRVRAGIGLVALGVVCQGAGTLALWLKAAPAWAVASAGMSLLSGATALALIAYWYHHSCDMSRHRLRDLNQALRDQIETLQIHHASQLHQQKMDALSQFSGGVSHYVNNILQVIGGALALLAPRTAMDRTAQDLITLSLAAADRGTRLSSQLLLFAQQPALSARMLNLAEFMNTLNRDLGPQVRPGITLVMNDWTGQLHIPLLIEAGEIMHALSNLLSNAQEAMDADGTIVICLTNFHASNHAALGDGYYLLVTVTDQGRGLASHLEEQAMVPFMSTRPIGTGAGLGLSVVYGIARRGGGTAMLESAPDGGAMASIYLRLALAEGDTALPREADATSQPGDFCEDFGGLSIMLVDDEAETRAIVALTLETLGCHVRQADGGAQALAWAKEWEADLFILDYAMPGMNGAQLARALLEDRPARRIAFLTGFADRVAIEATLGNDAVLVYKPASRLQLSMAITNALTQRQGSARAGLVM